MSTAWIHLFAFLSLAIGISFLCSVLEAVLLSITPAFIASQKGRLAKRLESFKRDIDRPLSAILTLNTFAHTIGAAGVGAAAQSIWGEESLAVVSAVATVLILIFSEIIPKTIGAVYWKSLVRPVIITTSFLTILLTPVVWICQFITRWLRHGKQTSVLSRQDLSQVAQLGHRDGLIREYETRIIKNLMLSEERRVEQIMTPYELCVMLPHDIPISEFSPHAESWHFSRIPITQDERVMGYVLKDEILVAKLQRRDPQPISELCRRITIVRSHDSLVSLYQRLISTNEHIAMVLDENENNVGLVTMEDLIEDILGQSIVDESDRARGAFD